MNAYSPSVVTNLMIGTLAFDMIATTSVICASRIARASSASNRPLLLSVILVVATTKSISLNMSSYHGRSFKRRTRWEGTVASAMIQTA